MHAVETLICRVIFQNAQSLRVAHANAIMNQPWHHNADALVDISIHYSGKAPERTRNIGINHLEERD